MASLTPARMTRGLLTPTCLICALCILYSSPLFTTYYMLDEIYYLFSESAYPLSAYLSDVFLRLGFFMAGVWNGRPIAMLLWYLFRSIASTFASGLFWIRVIQLAVSIATALFVHTVVLRRRGVPPWWALFAVLFIWSQPTFQIFHAVTMALPYWLAILAALLSVECVLPSDAGVSGERAPRFRRAAGLLVFAWLTFQAAPFCALGLLSFCALQATPADWQRARRRYGVYLGVFLTVLVLYPIAYKLYRGMITDPPTYVLVHRAFALLSGNLVVDSALLHPSNYLGPFEWWNYLYPIDSLPQSIYLCATATTALAWCAVCAASFGIEARRCGRRYAMERAGLVLASFGLTLLPIIAATLSRSHAYIATVFLVALTLVHCVPVVVRTMSPNGALRRAMVGPAIAVLVVVSLGARASFERAFVRPNERSYNFVVNEVRRQAGRAYDHIVVVNTPQACRGEPCRGMHNARVALADRGDAVFYQTIVSKNGGKPGLPIRFVRRTDGMDLSTALVVDYRILYRAETGSEPPVAEEEDESVWRRW